METLRRPLLIAAIAVAVAVVLVEFGSGALLDHLTGGATKLDRPSPGLGIRYLALIDVQLLFAVLLVGGGMLIPAGLWAKVQGPGTLAVGLTVLPMSVALVFRAIALLFLMIALITAFPFGTIAYLVAFGAFHRGGAAATLSLLMGMKIGFAVCLLAAHQRFLQNKGLVAVVLVSMACTTVVSFLHGLVPIPLVSILDAVAAIVVGLVAAGWAVLLLAGSLPSIVRAARSAPGMP